MSIKFIPVLTEDLEYHDIRAGQLVVDIANKQIAVDTTDTDRHVIASKLDPSCPIVKIQAEEIESLIGEIKIALNAEHLAIFKNEQYDSIKVDFSEIAEPTILELLPCKVAWIRRLCDLTFNEFPCYLFVMDDLAMSNEGLIYKLGKLVFVLYTDGDEEHKDKCFIYQNYINPEETRSEIEALKEEIAKRTNIENGTGENAYQMKPDTNPGKVVEGCFDFTGKNPHATAFDETLTGQIPYGATGNFASAEGGINAAQGKRSHTEGTNTIAKGNASHAEGDNCVTLGNGSHAEGGKTVAKGEASHAEGNDTQAIGTGSHAEGENTKSAGAASHSEGSVTYALGDASHAEGAQTNATGYGSHAEGNSTTAQGAYAHAEGNGTYAIGDYSHAIGNATQAEGYATFAAGVNTKAEILGAATFGNNTDAKYPFETVVGRYNNTTAAYDEDKWPVFEVGCGYEKSGEETEDTRRNALLVSQNGAIAQGNAVKSFEFKNANSSHYKETFISGANGDFSTMFGSKGYTAPGETAERSMVQGTSCIAMAPYSHAEGNLTDASGTQSHTEGLQTVATANGEGAHAEGERTIVDAHYCHAEGQDTVASAYGAHAEGQMSKAIGKFSHAEGYNTVSSGEWAHSEGKETEASGEASLAVGYATRATGNWTFATGGSTTASANNAAAFGYSTEASANNSLSAGENTKAKGKNSFAIGNGCIANANNSIAIGTGTICNHENGISLGAYSKGGSRNVIEIGTGSAATSDNMLALDVSGNMLIGIGDVWSSSDPSFGKAYRNSLCWSIGGGSRAGTGGGETENHHCCLTFGDNCMAYHSYSYVFGRGNWAGYGDQFVIGKYNNWSTAGGDAAFIIGNGSTSQSPGSGSNAFVINYSGNAIAGRNTVSSDTELTLTTKNYVDTHYEELMAEIAVLKAQIEELKK